MPQNLHERSFTKPNLQTTNQLDIPIILPNPCYRPRELTADEEAQAVVEMQEDEAELTPVLTLDQKVLRLELRIQYIRLSLGRLIELAGSTGNYSAIIASINDGKKFLRYAETALTFQVMQAHCLN